MCRLTLPARIPSPVSIGVRPIRLLVATPFRPLMLALSPSPKGELPRSLKPRRLRPSGLILNGIGGRVPWLLRRIRQPCSRILPSSIRYGPSGVVVVGGGELVVVGVAVGLVPVPVVVPDGRSVNSPR